MTDIDIFEQVWEPWLEKGDYRADFNMRRENRAKFHQLITRYFRNNARVLEIGCGTAIDTNILAGEAKDMQFHATDISGKSVLLANRISRSLDNKIFFTQGDINKLYFKDKVFDIVFSQGVLEHFPEPINVMREQIRVLKNDGVLIISVPQKYTAYTLMKKIKMYQNRWEWEWECEYSYGKLKRLGEQCGLLEIESLGYQYWRSWWELTWVLRDLYDKFYRRIPIIRVPFLSIKELYDKVWGFVERRWGAYFLQNLTMVFVKDGTEN